MASRRNAISKGKIGLSREETEIAARQMMYAAQAHQRTSVYCKDNPDAKPPNIDFLYYMVVSFELVLLSVEQSLRLLLLLHYSSIRSDTRRWIRICAGREASCVFMTQPRGGASLPLKMNRIAPTPPRPASESWRNRSAARIPDALGGDTAWAEANRLEVGTDGCECYGDKQGEPITTAEVIELINLYFFGFSG